MRMFIFGANGMLGTYFKRYFETKFTLIPITRSQCNLAYISDNYLFDLLVNKLKLKEDDIILNAAGIIKQREFNQLELIAVNRIFPHLLAEVKTYVNCKVVHVTTDCVYSGNKGNYIETDPHDCLDEYGKSKSLGESNKLTVIRTSIIGEELNNKKSLIAWCQSQKNQLIKGYTNHFWNGVTCLELCHCINAMIKNDKFWEGTRHVYSKNIMNKFEMVNLFNDIYNLNLTIQPVEVNICDRSLSSLYNLPVEKSISEQVIEQAEFNLDN